MFYFDGEVISIDEKKSKNGNTFYIYEIKGENSKFNHKILSFNDLGLVEGDQAFIPVWIKVNKGKYLNLRFGANGKIIKKKQK